jgi:hypothetical protein
MKRLLSVLRSVAIIGAITLAIDFLGTQFIPSRSLDPWVAAREEDDKIFDRHGPLNHEFKPNLNVVRGWGPVRFPFATDQYGLRVGKCAADNPAAEKDNTVFVVGDSFAEGISLPYEESFAGLLACAFRERGMAVRNLGTSTYSPIIYWRKVEKVAQQLRIKPKEIILFLDLSDILNEAHDYIEVDGKVTTAPRPFKQRFKEYLHRHFSTVALAIAVRDQYLRDPTAPSSGLNDHRAMWTMNKDQYEDWGKRGLELAAGNLEKIVKRCAEWGCRFTLVVYPWPDQVMRNDKDSIQVRYWRDWAAKQNVRFIEIFTPLLKDGSGIDTVARYYIGGDFHFNKEGSRVVFDTVWKAVDPANNR